ncbi:MAG: hypothetical protein ABW199_04305 [Caulobacterales bacterium]
MFSVKIERRDRYEYIVDTLLELSEAAIAIGERSLADDIISALDRAHLRDIEWMDVGEEVQLDSKRQAPPRSAHSAG